MKPTLRLILLALIILIFATVPVVHAQTAATSFTGTVIGTAICDDPPQSYSGNITQLGQIDYWEIKLAADQKLIIDVDAENIGKLDAYLVVLDKNETIVSMNNDQDDGNGNISLDPYLEVIAPSDDYYYIGISSASTDVEDDRTTGPYTFLVQCSDQSSSPQFKWPVEVGDLIGATGSDTSSLINITPENAESSPPFPLGIGPICDIEFDPSSKLVFVAVDAVVGLDVADYIPGRIVTINPDSGNVVESYSLETESVVSLEAAEDKLYVVRADSSGENFTLALVTFDTDLKTAKLTDVVSLGQDVRALAYNQSEKVMYGAIGLDLVKINLSLSPIQIQKVPLIGLNSEIVALDFSDKDVLYGVDRSGNLFNVPILSSGEAKFIGDPIVGLNSLTFVIGDAQDVEQIKTVCSSTLSGTITASSETDIGKLASLKLKKNPLHRAIGLFKFQGIANEKVTLRLAPEEEEAVVAGDKSSLKRLAKSWLAWEGKGRVFLGIRDAIPNMDFRARTKNQMPFDMSVELPADGYYYVMVIRPLLRFYQTDYCLTLESKHPESVAWQTLNVVWPGDDSEENTTALADEQQLAEPLTDDAGVVAASNAVSEPESTILINEPATVSPVPTNTNVNAGETLVESPTEGDTEGGQTSGDTNAVAPAAAKTPEKLAIEATEEPAMMGAPSIPEETTVGEPDEAAPAAETPKEITVEATVEPAVMGAPSIPEETTTVGEPGEVASGESADQISGADASVDGSGSAQVTDDYNEGVGSAEGDTSNLVEEDPPEASKL
jgi:hypothetical protein